MDYNIMLISWQALLFYKVMIDQNENIAKVAKKDHVPHFGEVVLKWN